MTIHCSFKIVKVDVIVTGSLGYDYIMDFPGRFADRIMPDKIHKLSLGFLVKTLNRSFGGTAGNIAFTLKLLGIEPYILSAAGNDFNAYAKHLDKYKLSREFIKIYKDIVTGSYFGITDQEDNQIGAFYEGAIKYNGRSSIEQIYSSSEPQASQEVSLYKDSSRLRSNNIIINFVLISPHQPQAMVKHVKECQKLKLPYLYDPAFQIDHFSKRELLNGIRGAQILIGNDYEIALIEKKLGVTHAELLKLTPIVVTTLGSKGSVIEHNPTLTLSLSRGRNNSFLPLKLRRGEEGLLKIKPARPKNTSDPTGAGDAYRAGFVAGYLRGFDLRTCGQMGSVAAVYTVEQYGTQTHHFTKKEYTARYEENFGWRLIL